MPETAPPLRWLFEDPDRRRQAFRYWFRDPVVGTVNLGIHYGMRLLPIDAASWIGAHLGAFAKYRYPDSDARARKLWIRIRPEEADEVDEAIARLWRNVGRTMVEFSVLDRLWDEGRITLVGKENVEAARAANRPLIGIGLHLGNWETIGLTLAHLGFEGGVIYMPPDNRFDHAIANVARGRIARKILGQSVQEVAIKARPNAAAEAFLLLARQKKQLLVYADELSRGRVWAPAFGRELRINGNIGNIVRLARLTNAVVVPIYCVRLGETANFRVVVLPPIELARTEDRDADIATNVAAIDRLITPVIRDHLDQWFFGLDFEFDG